MSNLATIADNIQDVRENIARACAVAGRTSDDVTLIAVSKTKPVSAIIEALDAGITHFGENRVEEAALKVPEVKQQRTNLPTWHMIGHIQSRKAKAVATLFDVVHGVDTPKLALKLAEQAQLVGRVLPIMLEINISGEDTKEGFLAHGWETNNAVKAQLWQEFEAIMGLRGLSIQGLMTMAPFYDEAEATRPIFRSLALLREALSEHFKVVLPQLSMGMTNDYAVAIEEGATMVRVGRAIFGER